MKKTARRAVGLAMDAMTPDNGCLELESQPLGTCSAKKTGYEPGGKQIALLGSRAFGRKIIRQVRISYWFWASTLVLGELCLAAVVE